MDRTDADTKKGRTSQGQRLVRPAKNVVTVVANRELAARNMIIPSKTGQSV
jgi:hypothetical protein